MDPYPVSLDVAGRAVLVVGGGPVAARRAAALVRAGAQVTVVAPFACEDITTQAEQGALHWQQREYTGADLGGSWLVHTATGDRDVDDRVAADAERARIWCVRADDAKRSTAWTPAVARVDDVTVAVTAGGDPRRAQAVRDAVQLQLETGQLPTRRRRPVGAGRVALVGGGPGDPGLITTRGRRLLAEADVVVVDRLAPVALLKELDEDVVVIDVGKAPDNHPVPQEEINRLLVEHAQAGRRVVRLKGGDPFVLGRGGEEALSCAEAGVRCEVVPGVTSAVAVPAAAGIPVTHRGLSRQFTVVSSHRERGAGTDWEALARLDGTLVLLMGVAALADGAAALIEHGRPASTPVAVIENGTTPRQRTTTATLETITEMAAERGVQAPAVVVVGDVVQVGAVLGADRTLGWERAPGWEPPSP